MQVHKRETKHKRQRLKIYKKTSFGNRWPDTKVLVTDSLLEYAVVMAQSNFWVPTFPEPFLGGVRALKLLAFDVCYQLQYAVSEATECAVSFFIVPVECCDEVNRNNYLPINKHIPNVLCPIPPAKVTTQSYIFSILRKLTVLPYV